MLRPIVTFATVFMALLCQSDLVGQDLASLAINGKTEEIEKAIKADPTALDRIVAFDSAMLHVALQHGQYKTAKKLIELGADVDLANGLGHTALHLVIQRRNEELFDLVMATDPSLDHLDSNQTSPLVQAIYYRQPEMAKKLVKAGCDISLKNNSGQTAAHVAASQGIDGLIELLLENGANVRDVDSKGTSTFMMLCVSGQLDLVKEHFDIALATQGNKNNENCLMYAAGSNSPELVEYLCEKTDLENTADGWGKTPLLVACHHHDIEIVKTLLRHGANPDIIPVAESNFQNLNYQPPLIHAAYQQNSDLVKALLSAEANVSIANPQGYQALHAACGAIEIDQNLTPQLLSESGAEIVGLLLEKGADPNAKNESGQTPLAIAVANNFPDGIDKLIKITTEVDFEVGQTSFLHWACLNQMPNTVTVLLERDASKANAPDQNGQTPLCIAAAAGGDEVVRILLANKADPNLAGEDGQLPLNCALIHQGEAVEMLLEAGASPSAVDGSGRSPIQMAGWHGNETAIKLLAKQNVDLAQATQSGSTALHFAAWQGHKAAAETLIDLGVAVDVADADGWTPLHKAAVRGDVEMIKLLLAKGADKTATDSIGLTALQKVSDKNREVLEPILK